MSPENAGPPRRERPRFFSSFRVRLLGSFVLLLGLATLASVIVVRQALLNRLDERIDQELLQEAGELRRLVRGSDPTTGRAFEGDVERIFEVFLDRNIPSRNESIVTFLEGEPFLRSPPEPAYRLDLDQALAERWANLASTQRDQLETPVGAVESLGVPIKVDAETRGVFVVAIFRDLERADTDSAILAVGLVALVMLLAGSVLAWHMAGRVLRPVGLISNAAQAISESDLTRRIEVTGGDEVGRLAETFNDMLDRLERAFGTQRRFIDDAGHEFRTPITIVRGHLELLEDDPDDRARTIELVTDELDRMGRMVEDLLTLTKAERPDFLQPEPVNVRDFTEKLFENARTLGDRDWRLDRTGSGTIDGDEQRLTQAVMQLADNAVRHTQRGDSITIGSAVEQGTARFWVGDTGPGIAPEDVPRIFDRFYRGSDDRRTESTGLGLSIVRAIADAHRGHVDVREAAQGGSIFTLSLPVRAEVSVT